MLGVTLAVALLLRERVLEAVKNSVAEGVAVRDGDEPRVRLRVGDTLIVGGGDRLWLGVSLEEEEGDSLEEGELLPVLEREAPSVSVAVAGGDGEGEGVLLMRGGFQRHLS